MSYRVALKTSMILTPNSNTTVQKYFFCYINVYTCTSMLKTHDTNFLINIYLLTNNHILKIINFRK
jgi:hypothetical protein